MSTAIVLIKSAGSSLHRDRPIRPPSPLPSLEEMQQGDDSDENTDSEEEDAEMLDTDSGFDSSEEDSTSENGIDIMMQAPGDESSESEGDDDYVDEPVPEPITIRKVKLPAESTAPKKQVGISLPKRVQQPLPPVDLDEALRGDESDEYMESEDGDSDAEQHGEDMGDLTVLLYGDGSASDAPGDEDESDLEDGDWPGPQGRRTRSKNRALKAAQAAVA